VDKNRALDKMQIICSQKEQCVGDIRKKLMRYPLTSIEIDKIIETLIESSFIDHRRYAKAYTNDSLKLKGWGRDKVRWMLRSKGVEEEYIEEALFEFREDDSERITALLLRKLESSKRDIDKVRLKTKLIRFGLSRGFEYQKVIDSVNKIMVNFV